MPSLRNSQGNSMVGMLLFLPLALFFLFVVIDAGLALIDKAAISNALRAGFNGEAYRSQSENPFQLTSTGIELDRSKLTTVIQNVAQDILSKIEVTLRRPGERVLQDIKVTVVAIPLEVNPENGVITGSLHQGQLRVVVGDTGFDLHQAVPDFAIISQEQFIEEQIDRGDDARPSPFALPAGIRYQPENSNSGTPMYLSQGVALYGEVTALARGNNSWYVKQVLNHFYALQEQQLRGLRGGLR